MATKQLALGGERVSGAEVRSQNGAHDLLLVENEALEPCFLSLSLFFVFDLTFLFCSPLLVCLF